jgi:hypothetical protein
MFYMTERYVQLIAALAVEKSKSLQFDLMMGFHPEEKRILTEDEDDIDHIIRFIPYALQMGEIAATNHSDPSYRNALLWLKYFPQLQEFLAYRGDELHRKLWEITLYEQTILRLAYIFYPKNSINHTEWKVVDENAKILQQQIDTSLDIDIRMRGKVCCTLPFPAQSALGKIIETQAGLSQDLKTKIGLTNYAPGLLCNYLLCRNKTFEEILNPYQFEQLTGMIFAEEGWKVSPTKQTRDGGKDIIAQKEIDNKLTVAYIQAKRYAEQNKVGISEVKEFVATVAGDKVDTGYMVTTSYFSKPAKQWLHNKGTDIATVELIDRPKLFQQMENIATAEIPVYLKM